MTGVRSTTTPNDAQGGLSAPVIIESETNLRCMERYLLSGEREQAVVALAPVVTPAMRRLTTTEARAAVGVGPRLYLLAEERLLDLQQLPDALALAWGSCARIWQPGLSSESDPDDHPLVRPLEGENPQEVLARQFDLSRPFVRKEIKHIEGIRAYYEEQLDNAITQLRRRGPTVTQSLRAGES